MSDPVKITEENFELAYDQIRSAFTMLGMFDWEALVEARNRADSIMHITDPTGYGKLINSQNAANNHKAAKATRDYLNRLKALSPENVGGAS